MASQETTGAYEPLKLYDRTLRDAHRKAAEACLQAMLARAKIDEAANLKLVKTIDRLAEWIRRMQRRVAFWGFLFWALLILSLGLAAVDVWGLVQVFGEAQVPFDQLLAGFLLGTPLAIFLTVLVAKKRKAVQKELEAIEQEHAKRLQEAWDQMAPLNEQLRWEVSPELIRKTTALFEIEPFLSRAREASFREAAHKHALIYPNEMVTFVLSGTVHGAPYLFLEGRRWQWEPKTYEGHLTIHWTEQARDSQGRSRTVVRTQTLVATVEKPAPVFYEEARLVYRSSYAPGLSFSREPSKYSAPKLGFFERLGKKREQKKLEKFSRNLKDDSDYTMMNNAEFETLFQTTNRDDEQGFRVLFSPLAQAWTLNLLRDREIAFGDDFTFDKDKELITITPAHLQTFSPEANVANCRHYDLRKVKKDFMTFEERYFKGFFASFMPVLSIPIHQTPVLSTPKPDKVPGEWFVEALANAHRKVFAPPRCTTDYVLKCKSEGPEAFEIEAQGFCTVDRVDFVSRFGGDGHLHDVPVPWKEYLPTGRISHLHVEPQTATSKDALLYHGFAGMLR